MRTPTSPLALGRFEHDDRNAAIGRPRLVFLVAGVELRRELPETLALGAFGFAGDVALGTAISGGFDLRVRLQIVIPGGMLRRPTFGGDQHDVRAIREIQERRGAPLAGLRAGMGQEDGRRREADADATACRAHQVRVDALADVDRDPRTPARLEDAIQNRLERHLLGVGIERTNRHRADPTPRARLRRALAPAKVPLAACLGYVSRSRRRATMIKLYGIPRSRTMRPLWMLEELGLPYENVKVSFVNETRTPAFLKVNPNGHIPVLQDGDLTLWESIGDQPLPGA